MSLLSTLKRSFKRPLAVRVMSTLVAISLLTGIYEFWGSLGFIWMGCLVSFFATIEFLQTALLSLKEERLLQVIFVFLTTFLLVTPLVVSWPHPFFHLALWGLGAVLLFSASLWQLKDKCSNQKILTNLVLLLLGLFYCSILPALTLFLLKLPVGVFWFLSLLTVVLSGDTLAYLGGRLWGKRKLHPQISPKKTTEGALCGLLGSILGAGISFLWCPIEAEIPLVTFLILGGGSALLAQCGDLFESLIKRVGDVKDSGAFMPGHGGVLDRIDGILFASPLFLIVALFYDSSIL